LADFDPLAVIISYIMRGKEGACVAISGRIGIRAYPAMVGEENNMW
jgi:hypothetical protein